MSTEATPSVDCRSALPENGNVILMLFASFFNVDHFSYGTLANGSIFQTRRYSADDGRCEVKVKWMCWHNLKKRKEERKKENRGKIRDMNMCRKDIAQEEKTRRTTTAIAD